MWLSGQKHQMLLKRAQVQALGPRTSGMMAYALGTWRQEDDPQLLRDSRPV